jgi:hypothetical protein
MAGRASLRFAHLRFLVSLLILALLPTLSAGAGGLQSIATGFIENRGQMDDAVRFYHRSPQGTIYCTSGGIVFDLDAGGEGRGGCVLRLEFESANTGPSVAGRQELPFPLQLLPRQ